jgi:hypothetical protein
MTDFVTFVLSCLFLTKCFVAAAAAAAAAAAVAVVDGNNDGDGQPSTVTPLLSFVARLKVQVWTNVSGEDSQL